jgi:hypothetical protein
VFIAGFASLSSMAEGVAAPSNVAGSAFIDITLDGKLYVKGDLDGLLSVKSGMPQSVYEQNITRTIMTAEDQKTVNVSSAAELKAALDNATGGEVILLAAGNYGDLISNHTFASEVTILSADPNDPAVFSLLRLSGVENLTIDSVKFDYTAGDNAAWFNTGEVQGTNITIRNSVFDGDLVDGTAVGRGLFVRDSSNVVIENNEFYHYWKAAMFQSSTDLWSRATMSIPCRRMHLISSVSAVS